MPINVFLSLPPCQHHMTFFQGIVFTLGMLHYLQYYFAITITDMLALHAFFQDVFNAHPYFVANSIMMSQLPIAEDKEDAFGI